MELQFEMMKSSGDGQGGGYTTLWMYVATELYI